MKKSLKNRIIIGVTGTFIAVMIIVTVVVSVILTKQNKSVANTLINNAFNIIRYTISEKQDKLLFDSRQMASLDDMGGKIKYVTESSPYFDYSTLRPTYVKIASVIYGTSTTADVWKASIYNINGELKAFAVLENNANTLGCVHGRDTVEVAVLKPDEELARELWTIGSSLPPNIEYRFTGAMPRHETTFFEIIDNVLCLVAHVPVMGKDYNPATEQMESEQVGILITIQKLGSCFVNKMSELTGTDVNIFTHDAMISGTLPDYGKLNLSAYTNEDKQTALSEHPVIFEDVEMDEAGYFQGVLPVCSDSNCVAAIVSLYSKEMAKANAVQIIKNLSFVYIIGTLLIVPITILVVMRGIIRPIQRVASMMREIAKKKEFTEMLAIESQDEIGDLASSFNEMTEKLRMTTTSIDNLNREIGERKKVEETLRVSKDELEVANQKIKDQLRQLQETKSRLLEASRRAGMAEASTSVLHNIGNVLNSVNVAAGMVKETIRESKVKDLSKVVELIERHKGSVGRFLEEDEKGKKIPLFLNELADVLEKEQVVIGEKTEELVKKIEQIKAIVALQQSYAVLGGVSEMCDLQEVVEDALQINEAGLKRHHVTLTKDFEDIPSVVIEKQKVLQILVNLISNAKYAMDQRDRTVSLVSVHIKRNGDQRVQIIVEDNGVGIPAENLDRIFNHGFTTRKDGHGFGLHSAALAAKELGGALTAHSDGPGKGAAFVLEIPVEFGNDADH